MEQNSEESIVEDLNVMHYNNKQIQLKSDNLLKETLVDTLNYHNLDLREFDLNTQNDEGEDYYIVVKPKEKSEQNDFLMQFFIQNKGVSNFHNNVIKRESHLYKNKIPFSLNLNNAKRYCLASHIPLIITISDIIERKVYWYSIQIDSEIRDRILAQDQNERASIQIYIEPLNTLDNESILKFIDDVRKSKEELDFLYKTNQIAKPKFLIIEKSFEAKNREENILDSLHNIVERFEGLLMIPPYLLTKLYPFALNENSNTHYGAFTLTTDNIELFDLFDSIELINNEITITKNQDIICSINDYQNKIRKVIKFFSFNLIHHILVDIRIEKDKRICIHKLFSHAKCDCEKCTYDRYDYKKCIEQLKLIPSDDETSESLMRKSYLFYKFGDFGKSFYYYKRLADKFLKQNRFISYFICKYNMSKLFAIIRNNYFGIDRHEILSTNLTPIKDELLFVSNKVSTEVFEILSWICDGNFLDEATWRIEDSPKKILDNHRSDQFGGSSKDHLTENLLNYTAQLETFLDANSILFDLFVEFSQVIYKSIEGFLASHSIQNDRSSRLDTVDDYILDLMLKNFDPDDLDKLFRKYHLRSIKYSYSNHATNFGFNEKLNCFLRSVDDIDTILSSESGAKNYYLSRKTEKILGNFLVLLSRIELENGTIVSLSKQLREVLSKEGRHYRRVEQYINVFIGYKSSVLGIEEMENWLLWALSNKKNYHMLEIITSFPDVMKKNYSNYTINNDKILSKLWSLSEEVGGLYDVGEGLQSLIRYIEIVEPECREKIKDTVVMSLDSRFNDDLYYTAAIFDIVDYKKYFEKYLETIPISQNREVAFFDDGDRNSALDNLINLAFKNDIDISTEQYQKYKGDVLYYQWLLNLETFDYRLFNPYWLLRYPTKFYFNRFKMVPMIKEKLQAYLLENPIEGLVKIFIRDFS